MLYDKLLSISIAAYNASLFLKKNIPVYLDKRVIDDIELIITNDGSCDDTQQVAEGFRNQYPNSIVVVNKENGGHGSTINSAIDIARGKYFCVIDADDWVNIDGLLKLVKQLKKNNSDMVLTCAEIRDEENHLSGVFWNNTIPENREVLINDYIHRFKKIEMHTYCVKTDILRKNNVRCHEHHFYTDLEYVMYSVMYCNTVVAYKFPFYQYLVGRSGQSVSIEGRRKHVNDYIDISFWLSDFYYQHVEEMTNNMALFYKNRIAEFVTGVYSVYLSYGSGMYLKETIMFDSKLRKKYPDIYYANKNKCVYLLRVSRFKLYDLSSKIYRGVRKIQK